MKDRLLDSLRHRKGDLRPFVLLLVLAVLFLLIPVFRPESSIDSVNVKNVLETLSALGLVTLALGLTMIAGEFDLSVSSTFLLGGMLAVKTGVDSPVLGVVVAVAVGLAVGLTQGYLIAKLQINSMAVTLGSFIALLGLVFVISNSQSINYKNVNVGETLDNPILSIFSWRILIALAIFAAVAFVFATAFVAPPASALLRWPAAAAFVALPVVLTGADLGLDWVRRLVALEVLSMAAVVVAASMGSIATVSQETIVRNLPEARAGQKPKAGGRSGRRRRTASQTAARTADMADPGRTSRPAGESGMPVLIAPAVALAAVVLVVVTVIFSAGVTPADLLNGAIGEAMRVRRSLVVPAKVPWIGVLCGAAALAAAAYCAMTQARPAPAGAAAAIAVRIAGAVAIWLSAMQLVTGPAWHALPLCVLAVTAPAGTPHGQRFGRLFLAAFALTAFLQVYPVAGSQVGIAAFALVPVGAICWSDAMALLARDAGGTLPRQAVQAISIATAVAFFVLAIAKPGVEHWREYRANEALSVHGAGLLRLPRRETLVYDALVHRLQSFGCTTFVGYPNLDSLYVWTGIDPPIPTAPGGWITGLGDSDQQRIVAALRSAPKPCVVYSPMRASFWLGSAGSSHVRGPLERFILDEFHSVQRVGEFSLMLRNEAAGQR